MCRLPSSLVCRVSSLPTRRDRVIQPEQYGTASCSRCSSAPLLSPTPPLLCLSGIQCVSDRGKREGGVWLETQQDALTRYGRDNHGGYGRPRPASFSFSILIFFHFPFHLLLPPFPPISSTFLYICSCPYHTHHILYFRKCFCSHLLYFPVQPPVGDIVIFR